MRAIAFILLFIFLSFFNIPAQAQNPAYDTMQIWSIDKNGLPAPMGLTLGQFANYLQSHKAQLKLLVLDNDLLELRVSDPRMNLHEHLMHTYVFELNQAQKSLLCNHFLLNGQEMGGDAFLANATFLFRLVAGMRHKYPATYNFQIINEIPDQNISDSDFYKPQPHRSAGAEICGRVLADLPVNPGLSFLLLEQEDRPQPYFYYPGSCQAQASSICGRILKKDKTDMVAPGDGIRLAELIFLHQCRPAPNEK